MVRIRSKWLSVLLGGMVVACMLAGCGGGGTGGGADSKKEAAKPAETLKLEVFAKAKAGDVELTSHKLAGYELKVKDKMAIKRIVNWNGKIVFDNSAGKTLMALAIKDGGIGLDKGSFKDGILKAQDADSQCEGLSVDGKGALYYHTLKNVYGYKDGKDYKVTDIGLSYVPLKDGSGGYLYNQVNFKKATGSDGKIANYADSFIDARMYKPLGALSTMEVDADGLLYVIGRPSSSGDPILVSFKADGQQAASFAPKDTTIAGPCSIVLTPKYVVVPEMDYILLWGKDGKFIGRLKNKELFTKDTKDQIEIAAAGYWDDNTLICAIQKENQDKSISYEFFMVKLP